MAKRHDARYPEHAMGRAPPVRAAARVPRRLDAVRRSSVPHGRVPVVLVMSRSSPERYWLVHPNGGRQLIDPDHFDLEHLAEQARKVGGQLIVEGGPSAARIEAPVSLAPGPSPTRGGTQFEPPLSALGPIFRSRLERIYQLIEDYELDVNARPTTRVLGGYYRTRRLVRVYTHDRQLGRRPVGELFDTFLHEIAHHIEYTEPDSYHARACGRVPGRMHSRLFWRILGDLKARWFDLHRRGETY